MAEDLGRMRDLGFNAVYITHNNDTIADPDGIEPGLAPPVWHALRHRTPSYDNANRIFESIVDVLDASVEVGIDVVLPIGYQIQMGEEWNAAHPEELRRDASGRTMNHWRSGETASPYSAVYRQDILEYYRWVDDVLVAAYPNIVALNLADEPMGADYSVHAKVTFQERYGRPFEAASAFERGEFASGVIADYAAWSADRWREINPEIWTMMSFHVQRDAPFLPDVERIFAATPPTFIVSADTHLDDGVMDRPITPRNVNLLYGMARSLGWLSNVYARPLMLWTSANAWGLKRTGGVGEALLNLDIVHDTCREVGGRLGMLMAWGWNIQGQGVYDHRGSFPHDEDTFIAQLSSALVQKRDRLSRPLAGSPATCLHVSKERAFATIGERRYGHLAEDVVDLSRFDFAGERAVYLLDGPALDEARRQGARVVAI